MPAGSPPKTPQKSNPPKDNKSGSTKKTNSTSVNQFPGPGTIENFQDWLDTNYPTWLNGGKLNKGLGYGNYGPSTQRAFAKYGREYQNSLSNSGDTQPVGVEKDIFDEYVNNIFFYSTNNQKFNVRYEDISKWLKYFNSNKFNRPTSYVGSVLAVYGNNISKYITDETIQNEIDSQLPSLQQYLTKLVLVEGIKIKRNVGLSQILEQISNLVTVNVVKGIPQKQTESDNYKDASNKTIKSIIGGGEEIRRGERSDTIKTIKQELGYTKDETPFFTEDFDKYIIEYKSKTEGLANDNGNISKDLICSIDRYKNLCSSISKQKTTTPPPASPRSIEKSTKLTSNENTQFKNNINVKRILSYSDIVDLTGEPNWDTCRMLIDTYSEVIPVITQSIKVGNMSPVETNDATLSKIKKSVEWCIAKHRNKFRLKVDDMYRINRLTTPFNINKNILEN